MAAAPVSVASGPQDQEVSEPKIEHAVLLTAAPLVRRILRVVFVILIARGLGPEQFGSYGLLLAIFEMIAVVSGSGYIDYLTREAARDGGVAWSAASQLVIVRWAWAALFSLLGFIVLMGMRSSHALLIPAACLFAAIIPRGISEAIQGVLRGIRQYRAYLAVELIAGLLLVAGGSLILARGGSVLHVVSVELASAWVACIIALVLAQRYRTGSTRWIRWSQVVSRSYVFNVYELVVNLYDRLDVVLLSKLAGDYATGIYTVAYRAMNTVQIIPYGIFFSLMPSFSRHRWEQSSQRQLERSLGLLVSVALAAGLATMAFVTPVTRLLLGARYLESAAALKVLIWAEVLMCVNYGLNIALLARGHERVFVKTALVCLAVNLAGNLLFIPRFSWRAAAVFTIVTEVVLLVQNLYWVKKLIGIVPRAHGALRAALVCLAATCAVLLAKTTLTQATVGAIGLTVFLLFLMKSGLLKDFRTTWAPAPMATE
jgi:O-antigen/teichoic acid export membrane protein